MILFIHVDNKLEKESKETNKLPVGGINGQNRLNCRYSGIGCRMV